LEHIAVLQCEPCSPLSHTISLAQSRTVLISAAVSDCRSSAWPAMAISGGGGVGVIDPDSLRIQGRAGYTPEVKTVVGEQPRHMEECAFAQTFYGDPTTEAPLPLETSYQDEAATEKTEK
jgi:hypothetical protein